MKLEKFEKMEIGKILDHIIDKTLYTTDTQTKVAEASKKILNSKYDLVAVTDPNGQVKQVVSNSDITNILSNEITLDPKKLIEEVRSRINYNPIYTEDAIEKLLNVIIQNKIKNVVIVDKDGKYYGIINKNKLKETIEEFVD